MEATHWIHDLDPVALSIGPLDLRWYALAYIIGLMGGWRWGMKLAARSPMAIEADHIDRFLTWAVIGVIVGGRLGAITFYRPSLFIEDPLEILMVWNGGMSFHGGLLGVMVAMILFARSNKIPLFSLTDIICALAPLGILFGRIANFINGEHWGRVTDVSWAVGFPRSGDLIPRHPSQLYEAALEGALLLFVLMIAIYRFRALAKPGLITGMFLVGYAVTRGFAEFYREPEALIGLLPFGTTWGQWLSAPMLIGGVYLVWKAMQSDAVEPGKKKRPA